MTLEQKVGQLLVVGFSGTSIDRQAEELIRGRQVGGICLFRRNIVSADQVARLNDDMRRLLSDSIPPFIAVDQEGGNVVRIRDGAVVLPGNMALGATGSAELAYEAGFAQAEDLKLLGFNMNLAPVLDVNLNPRNPVIGIRSFGDDADRVADFGLEFVRGQQDANVATVAKHFPGHGNTDADSHKALPVMIETEAEVMEQLKPFTAAIGEGLDGLMTAHVAVPSMTHDSTPATLSEPILTRLLRHRLGFDGLVLTDELEMEAIASRYGVGRAAVLAVKAGADMVLIPWRPVAKAEVYRSLLAAASSGEISRERLDEAVLRILTLKFRRGVFEEPAPLAERLRRLHEAERPDVAARIARASVTLLRAEPGEFPLRRGRRVGVITAEAALARALEARLPDVESLVVPAYPSHYVRDELRESARELALDVDVVVVGVINSRQLELVTMAAAANRPVLVVSMGLPYLVEFVPEAKAVLALYSYSAVSAEAAADALVGDQGTPGRLPVSLQRYRRGFGLDLAGQKVSTVREPR
jgi:beta-N-acetylhexosaminidase